MSARTCSDCGSPITRQSKTGRCRPCATARLHADPEYRARLAAGQQAYFGQPGVREERTRRLLEGAERYRADATPEQRARLSEHGRYLVREYLSRPDVYARSQAPEARARAIGAYVERRMGWCPLDLRPRYAALIRSKRIPAAEARRLIEAEIPGTAEYARRQIASHQLAVLLRHEREQAQAY